VKRTKQTKGIVKDRSSAAFEQHETYDDSLLPAAEELAKLESVKPGIIEWIMERTAKEQDVRLALTQRQVAIVEEKVKNDFRLDRTAMFLAFGVIVMGVGFSTILAFIGYPLYGSGFALMSILSAAGVFFRKRVSKTSPNN
jgi:uncharacterized membrane protein